MEVVFANSRHAKTCTGQRASNCVVKVEIEQLLLQRIWRVNLYRCMSDLQSFDLRDGVFHCPPALDCVLPELAGLLQSVIVGLGRPVLTGKPFFDVSLLDVSNDAVAKAPCKHVKIIAEVLLSDHACLVAGFEISNAFIDGHTAQRLVWFVGLVKLYCQQQFISGHNL
jgi:hypothetical protein